MLTRLSRSPRPAGGFTLIELLVVIVILGILVGLSAVLYSGSQDRANDSVVTTDMNQLRAAFADYATSNNKYPDRSVPTSFKGTINNTQRSYDMSQDNLLLCFNYTLGGTPVYTDYAVLAKSSTGNVFAMSTGLKSVKNLGKVALTLQTCLAQLPAPGNDKDQDSEIGYTAATKTFNVGF